MLGCILNFQMLADTVWKNARRFAEVDLEDPSDLWNTIVAIEGWNTQRIRRRYRLHRYRQGHARVQRIGRDIVTEHSGDAREIWENQAPTEIQRRLEAMRVGEQISRMIVGALYDTRQISGAGDLKADIHVRKVLGRVFYGKDIPADKALRIANEMIPGQSWMIDAPLYLLGQSICKRTDPDCTRCYLLDECKSTKNA